MEKYIDVILQTIELSETCLEGLEHVKAKLNEGQFENTTVLLHDALYAYYQMGKSIQPFIAQLPPYDMESISNSLHNAFELVVSAYERGERAIALEVIQFNLLPIYKEWHTEINRYLKPYLVC
ncbi:hypothetical protein [Desulfolucanica intricata]|uniref:hypothetical protein n=1 Tax=Desulfolucanica intricata TaxID=1285191 RepID=UPI00082DD6B4|nr:hypothetical protein [Desulfolucanica intricata]